MDNPEHQTEKQTIYWEGYYEGQEKSKTEIERLRKEKEWLLKQYATELYDMYEALRKVYNRDSIKQ